MYIKHELLLFLGFLLIHFFNGFLNDFICNNLMAANETFGSYASIVSTFAGDDIRNGDFYDWLDAARHVVHECRWWWCDHAVWADKHRYLVLHRFYAFKCCFQFGGQRLVFLSRLPKFGYQHLILLSGNHEISNQRVVVLLRLSEFRQECLILVFRVTEPTY